MRLVLALLALTTLGGALAAAQAVPLPRPRPPIWRMPLSYAEAAAGLDLDPAKISAKPTACDRRLAAEAAVEPLPRLIGPGACGGRDMVRVAAIVLPDQTKVALRPEAVLTCRMAQSLAAWLRYAVAPALAGKGAAFTGLENYDSYECRTRNHVPGAKLSEHAHGDAIDVRAFSLAGGRRLALTDPQVDQALRTAWRDAACHSFTTVLGPGDRYHSGHIHLDDIVRHNGYRICEWEVRVPPPPPKPGESGPVPLPRPRPAALGR